MHSSVEWKNLLEIDRLYFYNIYDLVYSSNYFKTIRNLLHFNKPKCNFVKIKDFNKIVFYSIKGLDLYGIPDDLQEVIINHVTYSIKKDAVMVIIYYYRKYILKKHFRNACERFLRGRYI